MPQRSLSAALAVAAFLAPATVASQSPAHVAAAAAGRHWVATWGASPQGPRASGTPSANVVHDRTIRQVVRVSMGGDTVRVRLSNEFGSAPLVIGSVHLALSAGAARIVPGTDRALTFAGDTAVTIPAGAPALSDRTVLDLGSLADVAISLYLPDSTAASTYHGVASATTYLSPPGNHTGAETMPVDTVAHSWYFLSGISVRAPRHAAAIVAFGNSITDGDHSTVDGNARWPDVLARHLQAAHALDHIAVVDEGISGNRVLHDETGQNALARFDRDVGAQPGARYVIVLEGINDIGWSEMEEYREQEVSAAAIIAGYKQLIARAHEAGLVIYGATLTPYGGSFYYSAAGEAKREAINEWIRTSGAFDAVIDFDQVTRDPAHPLRFLPQYDSGDHLHPGDAGYQAMGEAIELGLFGVRREQ